MKSSWKSLPAALAVVALTFSCMTCGGGAAGSTGSTLSSGGTTSGGTSSGGGTTGGSGSGSGSGSGGGSGSGSTGGSGSGGSTQSACSAMSTGQGASLNGFIPFASDHLWNQDISASPVDTNSTAMINFIGPTVGLHPDFGSGQYQGSNIGIPYVAVR